MVDVMCWKACLLVLVFAEVLVSTEYWETNTSETDSCFRDKVLAECTEEQRMLEVHEKPHVVVNEDGKIDRAEILINRAGGEPTEEQRMLEDHGKPHVVVYEDGKVDRAEILINRAGGKPTTKAAVSTGVSTEAVIAINLFKPAPNMLGVSGHSGGVLIHPVVVLTCCSCVSYQINVDQAISAWNHDRSHIAVGKIEPRNLLFSRISEYFKSSSQGKDVFLHPKCDNHYEVDIALAVLVREISGTKPAWIHTFANIQIPRTRIMTSQELLSVCSIPIWDHALLEQDSLKFVIHEPVYYQAWWPCESITCPSLKHAGVPKDAKQDPKRCNNTLDLARSCIMWKKKEKSLCEYYPGAPVFCDIGGIDGFMGFRLKYSFVCDENFLQSSVVQGLNTSLEWIQNAMKNPLKNLYKKKIPDWMAPKKKAPVTTSPEHSVKFSSFTGHQLRSIVNVYKRTDLICRGTLVTRLIVVVPCSCVTHTKYQSTNLKHEPYRYAVSRYLAARLTVILMIYENITPRTRIEAAHSHIHPQCDSWYDHDYSYLELSAEVPNSKVAWLMTSNPALMLNLTRVLLVSDNSMGRDCFIYDRNEAGNRHSKPVYTRHVVRFAHWHSCLDNVCSSWKRHQLEDDRCYGKQYFHDFELNDNTRFCVQSEDPKKDICNLLSGTPVFCNVEAAKGFVGFLTRSWTYCTNETKNDTAVFFGIDKFLPIIGNLTWIYEVENLLGKLTASHATSPTWRLLYIVALTSLYVYM